MKTVLADKETMDTLKKEMVSHPSHYGGADNTYEAIKIIEAMGIGKEFCIANIIKYSVRAGKKTIDKDPLSAEIEDFEKVEWYTKELLKLLRNEREAIAYQD
jgi:hypothetical protein